MIDIKGQRDALEPCVVAHDLHASGLFSDASINGLLDRTSEEKIRSKTAVQDHAGSFSTVPIGKEKAIELLHCRDSSIWIALHSIEHDPVLNDVFVQMAQGIESSLHRPFNKILYCAGALFISRGSATTSYHMDFGNNLLLQVRGSKRFNAYSPTDRSIVTEKMREEFFYLRSSAPVSMKYSKDFDRSATIVNLEPGVGIYMPTTTPHLTTTLEGDDISVSISLSFVNPPAERLRRISVLNYKYPSAKAVVPDLFKDALMQAYEKVKLLGGSGYVPRHANFEPRSALRNLH